MAGRRKGGVAFPDQVVAGVNGRIEGTEGDGRIDGRRQEIADREDQARRVEGERDRRAVQNVVGGDDVQLVRIGLGPIEEHLPDPFSLGDDQGAAAEVFWRDGRLLDQGIVVFHEQAPIRGVGQGMGVVSGPVRSVEEDDEIQTAVIESFGDVGSVTDVEGKADFRILLMKGRRGFGISLLPAAVTTVSICGSRLFWIFAVFPQYHDFYWIMMAYPVSLAVTAVCIFVLLLWYRPAHRFGGTSQKLAYQN